MGRDYNGLTGREVLEAALLLFEEKLSKEGRLSDSQVYHNVRIRGKFWIDSYPHEPATEEFVVNVEIGEPVKDEIRPAVFDPESYPQDANITLVELEEEHPIPDLTREKLAEAKVKKGRKSAKSA